MGMSAPPPAPIFDPFTFGTKRQELKPYPPLPWIYRDPQRWLLPSLTLIAILTAGLIL